METIRIHPEDTNIIPNSNILDLGILRKGSRSTNLGDVYNERALMLVPNNSQSGGIGYYSNIQETKKPGVLSEDIQSLSDDIGFLLYPPDYMTSGEKMLCQKSDSERTQRIFTHILPKKMQIGAMADAGVIVHGNAKTTSHLFYSKFDDALIGAMEASNIDSQISRSIMSIFRTIRYDLIENFYDIFSNYRVREQCGTKISNTQKENDIMKVKEKINDWKRSLSYITIGEYDRFIKSNYFSGTSEIVRLTSNSIKISYASIDESGFSKDEYSHLSEKMISREFARRVSSIFELFVENYVKTLWAQEKEKNPEISV